MDPELYGNGYGCAGWDRRGIGVMRNRAGNGKTFPDEDLVDRVKR